MLSRPDWPVSLLAQILHFRFSFFQIFVSKFLPYISSFIVQVLSAKILKRMLSTFLDFFVLKEPDQKLSSENIIRISRVNWRFLTVRVTRHFVVFTFVPVARSRPFHQFTFFLEIFWSVSLCIPTKTEVEVEISCLKLTYSCSGRILYPFF